MKKIYSEKSLRSVLSLALLMPWLLSVHLTARAQVPDLLPSSPVSAGAGVARTDCWTAFGNPATMVQQSILQIACQYENRYIISELSGQMAQVGWHSRIVNVGIAYMHFGYGRYGEHLAGIALARDFGGRFSLGLQANYYAAYMGEEVKYAGTFIPQAGMTLHLTPRLTLGVHSFNPFQQRLRGQMIDKPLPSTYSIGTAWHIGNDFDWMVQVEKEVSHRFRIASGAEWQAVRLLRVKLGAYYDDYLTGCLGVGLTLDRFRFDVNCDIHPILGLCTLGRFSFELTQ